MTFRLPFVTSLERFPRSIAAAKVIVSAESRFAASSKDDEVRVDDS